MLHGSFVLPFDLAAAPARVFAAYAEPALRQRWFRLSGDPTETRHHLDFRVGGGEIARAISRATGVAEAIEYHSWFADIVPDRRIVLAYRGAVGGVGRWASLVTVDLAPITVGTRLTHTEQYAFFVIDGDGSGDVAHLEGGTRLQLNGLAAVVEGR